MGANERRRLAWALVLFGISFFVAPIQADEGVIRTGCYVFEPVRSTIVQTGGFAGVHWMYSVEGQFCLILDSDEGTARFERIDANAVDASEPVRTLDPNAVFNLTALAGDVADETIEFAGQTDDGSRVHLTLAFADDTVHLTGQTTPPPNSADFFLFAIDAVAIRKYAGGTGDPNTPYQIATATDLIALGETPEDYDKHFILTADIDLDPGLPGGKVFAHAVIPLFTGGFDGRDYVISNLVIEGNSYLGLFGLLAFPAEVRNIGVVDVSVTGSGSHIGGLLGANGAFGLYLGGTPGAKVTNCHSTGSISGGERVGGLVGENWLGSIANCSSSGSVGATGRYSDVGGLVGWSFGIVSSCRSSGMVSGEEGTGGLVGSNGGKVGNCYSTSSVSGTWYVGGLVGWGEVGLGEESANGEITACYSTGRVSGYKWVGGLVGTGLDTVASFWDIQTSGQTTSAGGTGLTTAEMQTAQTFLDAGWGFVSAWPWWILENQDYPRLSWEDPMKRNPGSGTEEDPYRIYTPEQLILLGTASKLWDKHLILAADIDLDPSLPGGQVFTQALIPTFAGVFDGNGHVISGLTIEGSGPLGLFGEMASGAVVKNLGVLDASISGSSSVGALVGENRGSVMRCCGTGTVGGNFVIGGLVGGNWGDLTQCYSAAAVSGNYIAGGLVGFNHGSVVWSYSSGSVNGTWHVGGLVGSDWWGPHVAASFWDIETSDQTSSAGGTGKTTAEMQTAATYLDAGWDFVGETANGTDDVWWILEGQDYPRLWWERDDEASL